MLKSQKDLSEVIQQALDAIDSELEAVRFCLLENGFIMVKKKRIVGSLYMGLRPINLACVLQIRSKRDFKVKIRVTHAEQDKEGWKAVEILEFKDGVIWIEFDKDFGIEIDRVEVEWENDFVWIKLQEQLELLQEQQASSKQKMNRV